MCEGHVYVKPLYGTRVDETCVRNRCWWHVCKGHTFR